MSSSKTIKPLLSTFSPYSLCAGVLKSFAIISNNSTTPASFILPFSLGGRIILAILSYISVTSQYKSWSLASSPGLANTIQALYVIFFALYKAIISGMTLSKYGIFGLITTILSIYFITT